MSEKNIIVPDIGGAHDVDVIEVLVKPGDVVKVDTPLLTLESDKASMEIPSTAAGVVKEVKVKVSDKVSQGSVIVVLDTAETATAAPEKPVEKPAEKPITKEAPPIEEKGSATVIPAPHNNTDVHAGPMVRKLAREFGVDLTKVNASGPKQRIVKEDLQMYVKSKLAEVPVAGGNSLPASPVIDFSQFGEVEAKPLSRIKKISGKNLHRNWLLVPHVTQFGEADITDLEAFRSSEKATFEKQGLKLTPLVFIMKAVASALKAYPQFNASLDQNGENIILKKYVHVGVAVDTPDGLVVPVIRDVDKKGLADLARDLSVASEKARKKQLTALDMQGGSFSISSLGGIGGTAFTPIVNLPEVAILGVSKSSYKPVYTDGQFVPRLMLPLSLSYDHRVIDGADGARFIAYLTDMLGDVRKLLL